MKKDAAIPLPLPASRGLEPRLLLPLRPVYVGLCAYLITIPQAVTLQENLKN